MSPLWLAESLAIDEALVSCHPALQVVVANIPSGSQKYRDVLTQILVRYDLAVHHLIRDGIRLYCIVSMLHLRQQIFYLHH